MSRQAVQAFREQVNTSPALQAEVARHVSKGVVNYAAIGELARAHGFEFTLAEAQAALAANDDELSDFEMELVSGGSAGVIGKR